MDLNIIKKEVNYSRWVVVSVLITVFGLYALWFGILKGIPLSQNTETWGAFGDFVGGILNPVVAFFAFYWLTVSVLIQKHEMGETRLALQETKDAQIKQAETSERVAQFELIKMDYQYTLMELEAEYTYLNRVLSTISSSGYSYDKEGELRLSKDIVDEIQTHIHHLIDLRNDLSDQAATHLRYEKAMSASKTWESRDT